jgi:threonine synthase
VSGYTFEQAVMAGLAPDGGLLVPEVIPQVSASELKSWENLAFPDLSYAVSDVDFTVVGIH